MSARVFRSAVTGLAIAALAAPGLAGAATCFTGFGGTVHYQFTIAPTKFVAAGTRTLAGATFGALSPCAGLSQWPLLTTEIVGSGTVTLAFRAMTVDASGCGAVDEIVSFSTTSLSGTLQLHNDRTNFSNTTTLVESSCATPPVVSAALARGRDIAGNE